MKNKKKVCAAIIVLLTNNKRRNRKKWVKEWILKHKMYTHVNLLNQIKIMDMEDFYNYLRMNNYIYNKLLNILKPSITKKDTILRESISADERLAVTLRFLATGRSFNDLRFSAIMGASTISEIIIETCEAIVSKLKNYIKLPDTYDDWKEVSNAFEHRWNFGNCIGAIDGKHVLIRKPPHSGSMYFNYKRTFSIVLMAIVNANYEFMMVDAGTNGRVSDGGVLFYTTFGKKLRNSELNLPPPSELVNSDETFPYVFIGDEAFALDTKVMKPYNQSDLTSTRRIFNYRLSRAHQVVENAFSILASRFGVFQKPINLCPEKATIIVLACCYVHNFLIKENGHLYCSQNLLRQENLENGQIVAGCDSLPDLLQLQRTAFHSVSSDAKEIREKFCRYFSNEGKVPWKSNIF